MFHESMTVIDFKTEGFMPHSKGNNHFTVVSHLKVVASQKRVLIAHDMRMGSSITKENGMEIMTHLLYDSLSQNIPLANPVT